MFNDTERKNDAILKDIQPLAEYHRDLDLRKDLSMDLLDVIEFYLRWRTK